MSANNLQEAISRLNARAPAQGLTQSEQPSMTQSEGGPTPKTNAKNVRTEGESAKGKPLSTKSPCLRSNYSLTRNNPIHKNRC